jgi:hypothetical protein
MTILSVVKDVALGVGVNPPTSMFAASVQPRTQAELLSLANEMAQRIAYDVREWRELKLFCTFAGPGAPVAPFNNSVHPLPANYRRMLVSSQVYASWMPRQPLSFIADTNEWLVRRMSGAAFSFSEYTLLGNSMLIYPALAAGQSVSFAYLDKNCVALNSGGYGDQFLNDLDTFRLPERILKLGMLWQWKANKGSPYAEDMGTYTDALFMYAGSNQPAPIIVDRMPISSSATVAYPYPVPTP